MRESILEFFYNGMGLEKSYRNDMWMVGIKNYKPASDINNMDSLERHMLTDELFVPVTDGNVLVYLDENMSVVLQKLEVGAIYCVLKGVWHNVIMPENGKIVLIERPDTSMDNSEQWIITPEQMGQIRSYWQGK